MSSSVWRAGRKRWPKVSQPLTPRTPNLEQVSQGLQSHWRLISTAAETAMAPPATSPPICSCWGPVSQLPASRIPGVQTLLNPRLFQAWSPSLLLISCCCCWVSQSCQTLCDPHGLQHTKPPCPSLSPRACSNSYPLSQWCHPTIPSSVTPFSSCLQPFPVSGSFPMSQLFTTGGQSIGTSASELILMLTYKNANWNLLHPHSTHSSFKAQVKCHLISRSLHQLP